MIESLLLSIGLTRREFAQQIGAATVMAAMPMVGARTAMAQSFGSGFSFSVCADTRPMMYLPYKQSQTLPADAVKGAPKMPGITCQRCESH